MNKEAELLVKCEYAIECVDGNLLIEFIYTHPDGTDIFEIEPCIPYADTLEGRRQACSLIEHFRTKHNELWRESKLQAFAMLHNPTWWEHALGRLKWCIKQLEENDVD